MKKVRKIALPLAILLIGAGSAYATNVASESKAIEVFGYKYDPANPEQPCEMTSQRCETINTGLSCTVSDPSGVHNLFNEGCESELFRIP
ncbi:hypothetical protein SAMN05421664_3032 [Chryseobacterium soldanellicola]|uniref:Uncharacterized protein n=1 Tax=Chryseobacterium soldanellicola TaxID=311333 RepID=A0A1H1FF02_9FLAO|nr:DUF6520 family protein [Chryseobacterium soldanellicola]SDQ99545.1 hypothetical protein SAMN05421664_3032 [Chryseobacterium soldanellicola]